MAKRQVHPPIISAQYIPPDPRDAFPKFTKVRNFRKGKAYEHKVIRELKSEFPETFRTGTNIMWTDKVHKRKTAKPDGVLYLNDTIVVLEVKTTLYGDNASFKRYVELEKLYIPLMQHLHPDHKVYGVYVTSKVCGKLGIPRTALSHLDKVKDPLSYLYLDTFTP